MKIISSMLVVSALVSVQAANAQTTTQQLPPLPTTQPQAQQPVYAPAQQQYQQPQAYQYQQAPQQAQANPLVQPTQTTAPAPQQQAAQTTQPASQPTVIYQTVPVAEVPPAGPSHTVSRSAAAQPAFAPAQAQPAPGFANNTYNPYAQPAQTQVPQAYQQQPARNEIPVISSAEPQPQQQWQPQPVQQFNQPAPAQTQPLQVVQQPAQAQAAPVQTQAQPQQLQQFQPASGQPVAQAQPVAPQPIAVPAAQPAAEPASIPSTNIANIPPASSNGLYTLATVSSAIPMAKASLPKNAYKTLDEDSWKQIEFTSLSNRDFINNQIREVIAFKQQNWAGSGFRNVYVRPEGPVSFQSLNITKSRLPKTKTTSLALKSGSVSDGFTIADKKSGWFMYGQKDAKGKVLSLAISPDDMPMSKDFAKQVVTAAGADLMLVDWYKDRVVDTSSAESVLDWAAIYKPSDLVKN